MDAPPSFGSLTALPPQPNVETPGGPPDLPGPPVLPLPDPCPAASESPKEKP